VHLNPPRTPLQQAAAWRKTLLGVTLGPISISQHECPATHSAQSAMNDRAARQLGRQPVLLTACLTGDKDPPGKFQGLLKVQDPGNFQVPENFHGRQS